MVLLSVETKRETSTFTISFIPFFGFLRSIGKAVGKFKKGVLSYMEYQMLQCTQCNCKMRLPRNKGVLEVTCPRCKNTFRFNSGPQINGPTSDGTSRNQKSSFTSGSYMHHCIISTRSKIKMGPILAAFMIIIFAVFAVMFSIDNLSDDSQSQIYLLVGCCALLVWAAVDINNRAGSYIEVFENYVQGKAVEGTFLAKIREFHVSYSEIRNINDSGGRTVVLFTVYGDYKVIISDSQKRNQVIEEIRRRIA